MIWFSGVQQGAHTVTLVLVGFPSLLDHKLLSWHCSNYCWSVACAICQLPMKMFTLKAAWLSHNCLEIKGSLIDLVSKTLQHLVPPVMC